MHISRALAALLSFSFISTIHAGQYFQDFSAFSQGATSFGDGSQLLSTALGSGSGAEVSDNSHTELQLTAVGGTGVISAFELPDLDAGAPVYAFSVKWNGQIYGNFQGPNAADGFSFNFGQLSSLNLTNTQVESGYGVGLCFSVRTYVNNSPGFSLLANGVTLASASYTPATQWGIYNATRHFWEVDWNYTNGMSVRLDGQAIFSNVATTNFTPHAGDVFVWAARCGGESEEVRLDNIVVMTGGNLVQATASSPFYSDPNTDAGYPAANAFDGNAATAWQTDAQSGYVGATVNASVGAYVINSGSQSQSTFVQRWTLEGSDSLFSWVSCGSGFANFLNQSESRAWLGSNAAPFTAYRLNISTNWGATNTTVGELSFYRFSPVTLPVKNIVTNSLAATNLFSFNTNSGNDCDGGLTLFEGKLYGVTSEGGTNDWGTIFSINPDGSGFTVLHSFDYYTTGGEPEYETLVVLSNKLYGTTEDGGTNDYGIVFAMNTDGTGFTVLRSFNYDNDGGTPYSGLALAGNTFYGTTSEGGTNDWGTVFAINTDGTGFTVLHTFDYYDDGGEPYGTLAVSSNKLYGTTQYGGTNYSPSYFGNGTVFSLNTDGTDFTNLHVFTPLAPYPVSTNTDGADPYAGVTVSGNRVYGVASYGGIASVGTIFTLNTDGTDFTIVHEFTGQTNHDGGYPYATLLLRGNTLFGTTGFGGQDNAGTVFAISTNGASFTNLYTFDTNSRLGGIPYSGVVLSGNILYGTTAYYGTNGSGAIYAISLPIPSLAVELNAATNAVVSWTFWPGFTLQSSTNVAGPYLSIPAATSSYTNNIIGTPRQFFRLRSD